MWEQRAESRAQREREKVIACTSNTLKIIPFTVSTITGNDSLDYTPYVAPQLEYRAIWCSLRGDAAHRDTVSLHTRTNLTKLSVMAFLPETFHCTSRDSSLLQFFLWLFLSFSLLQFRLYISIPLPFLSAVLSPVFFVLFAMFALLYCYRKWVLSIKTKMQPI